MPDSYSDEESLIEIIGCCGSFVTLRERTISFVHQSAKDLLLDKSSNDIFPFAIKRVNHTIFSRSLNVMQDKLQLEMYSLKAPRFSVDHVKRPDPDPLAAVRYSCLYWIGHLLDCDAGEHTDSDGGLVDEFLRKKYIYCLEAFS
jgi:hypothetical protein